MGKRAGSRRAQHSHLAQALSVTLGEHGELPGHSQQLFAVAMAALTCAYDAAEHLIMRSEVRKQACESRARCAGVGPPTAWVAGCSG